MSGYHLNHINIRTASLEDTRDFYAEVLGLENGFRPPFPNPGYWMYAGKGLDHFAMWGAGLGEQLAVLEKHGIEYRKRLAGGGAVIQVFFHDPNGVQIELGFNPETEGITRESFDGEILE